MAAYYQQVAIKGLADMDACDCAEDRIDRDPSSYTNPAAARKGAPCTLKVGAERKIEAIRRRWNVLAGLSERE